MKILITLFILSFSFIIAKSDGNDACLRCHSMENLGVKIDHNGMTKNYYVNHAEFLNSNHGSFYCTDCHNSDFEIFPHPAELKSENIYCLDCHENDPDTAFIQFESIEEAFFKSVHYKKVGDNFTCFNCHDPHTFKISARTDTSIASTVLYDNHICLDCHNNSDKISVLTEKVFPSLEVTHQWLPHQNLHWANVRCIDCHTDANEAGVSHLILPKENAVKNCVECHSANSILTHTLYKFETASEREKQGFVNAVILNNSYVVGATRNYYLNILSFLIFGFTLIGVTGHGILVWRANKKHHSHEISEKQYFYPLWLRIWHWINALLFVALIVSGITLQYANQDNWFLSFSSAITLHNSAGITLTFNYLLFFLGNLVSGNYKQYIPKLKGIFTRLFVQARFYLWGVFKGEPHPYEVNLENKFNPLQQITYTNIMYLVMPIIFITGWALLFPEFIVKEFFGESGLFLTAILHTVTGFFLSLFMIGHFYLAISGKTIKEGIKPMIDGYHHIEKNEEK